MFPKDFLWGAATSSHQVEGENTQNDWWRWEVQGKTRESSGQACRHYEFFDQDFQFAQELHHNAHRFSLEWSRIEPQEGHFSQEEIQHYQDVLKSLLKYHLTPVVTLHHFTNPLWFFEQGGWLNDKSHFLFGRYVEKVVQALGQDVPYWITINEPEVFTYYGYLLGRWPPGLRSFPQAYRVMFNLLKAHREAYVKIHDIYRMHHWPKPAVSLAKNLMVFKPCPSSRNPLRFLNIFVRNRLFNDFFLEKSLGYLDFIGVNYYARDYVCFNLSQGLGLFGERCNEIHQHGSDRNALGWDSYPEGIYEVLHRIKKFNLPVIITENGTCHGSDDKRWQYVRDHLAYLQKAIDEGIHVMGYLYWSLLDNFEWHLGFGPRFGLIEVDYQTYHRRIRESARRLSEIYKNNRL